MSRLELPQYVTVDQLCWHSRI